MSETDKISEMQEAVAHLIDEASALEEKMLWNFEEVNKKLDHITGVVENLTRPMVTEAKAAPTQAKREDAKILGDSPPTLFEALKAANLNVDDLDALPDGTVKTKRFLGDIWGQYNAVFEGFGYKWVKGVGWGKSGAAPTPTPVPPTAKVQTGLAGDPSFMTIASINSNMKEAKIKARVLGDPERHDRNTRKGPMIVYDFEVDDGSAVAKVSLWNESPPQGISGGRVYAFTGLQVKEPYNGKPQLTIVKSTQWAPVS